MTAGADVPEAPASVSGAVVVEGWPSQPHVGLYIGVAFASAALLMLEISLTRLFSFTIWYHLTYLTISMALLGFSSSGAIVAAFPNLFRQHGHHKIVLLLVLAAFINIAALVFFTRSPLEVLDLLEAPGAFAASLLMYYIAVGVPFLLAGFAVGVPFAAYPGLMGRLYFWDLLGAAAGCILAVTLIEYQGIPGVVISASGLMLASAAVLGIGMQQARCSFLLAGMAAVVLVLAAPAGSRLPIEVTSSKRPPTLREDMVGAEHYVAWTALNRVDAAGWDRPTRRQFWRNHGLMKGYFGPVPLVARVTYDGCNGSNIYSFSGDFAQYQMLEHHLLRTPYLISDEPRVLVIGVGGGIDVINAIKQGAAHVTGAELQPKTIHLLEDRLREFTGGFYHRPDVRLVASEGRHFVRKTDERFDLIQITATDTFAAQATGAYVLAESYLYTVEAIQDYLSRLTEEGLISLVVGDRIYEEGFLPPLAGRLALTAERALAGVGVAQPADHVMVIGSLNSRRTTRAEAIIVKKSALTRAEVDAVREFASSKRFDVLYAPERFSADEGELTALLGQNEPRRQRALSAAWFRIDAVHDDDPFFYNVGKWSNFGRGATVNFMFPGSSIGQLVLLLMVAQSVLLGGALILLPLARGAREGFRAPGLASYFVYFLALGVGFMFVEISFVQSFVLFLGSPTYALSVTIFSLLLFSSFGSLLSTRFVERPEWALRRLAPIAVVIIVIYAFGLHRIFELFLPLAFPARLAIAVAAQLPVGLTLGMFMPLGIACIARHHPRLVPWAWGINGVGSVTGTTLAVLIAMSWGFAVVAMAAACLYAIGALLLLRTERTT